MPRKLKIYDNLRIIPYTRKTGGILRPTYGIRINKKIKALIKREKIWLVCLRHRDFRNFVTITDNKGARWVAFANTRESVIVLDATVLKSYKDQAVVDFVCLHEIEHIRRTSWDEDKVDRWAVTLGKRMGIPLEGLKKYPTYKNLPL